VRGFIDERQGDAGTRRTSRLEVRSVSGKERRDQDKNKRENNGIK
jgi:hypothetical protein